MNDVAATKTSPLLDPPLRPDDSVVVGNPPAPRHSWNTGRSVGEGHQGNRFVVGLHGRSLTDPERAARKIPHPFREPDNRFDERSGPSPPPRNERNPGIPAVSWWVALPGRRIRLETAWDSAITRSDKRRRKWREDIGRSHLGSKSAPDAEGSFEHACDVSECGLPSTAGASWLPRPFHPPWRFS